MVSSELVVLLIVCVGTGSTQEYCQDGPSVDRRCDYNNFDMNITACMDTHLICSNTQCLAFFNGINHRCFFNEYVNTTVSEPIRCCFCSNSGGNITELWWDCDNATLDATQMPMPSSSSSSPSSNETSSTIATMETSIIVTMGTSQDTGMTTTPSTTTITTRPTTTIMITTPTLATTPSSLIVIVAPVVVVLVVCLLVVCVIATIIILYQRARRSHYKPEPSKYELTQPPTAAPDQTTPPVYSTLSDTAIETRPAPPAPYNGQLTEEGAPDDYSVITNKETQAKETRPAPPAPYNGQLNSSSNEGAPDEYSVITDKPRASMIPVEANPAYRVYSTVEDAEATSSQYSVVTETSKPSAMTSDEDTRLYSHSSHGHTTTHQLPAPSVYSTLAEQRDDTPDTSNEGLVYSAVVVKDGKKTTVKTMATPQDEDTEQTPDTVQPTEGMVYSAVVRQDGKKTSVKITVD